MPSPVRKEEHSRLDYAFVAVAQDAVANNALLLPVLLVFVKIVAEWGTVGVHQFPAVVLFSVLSFDLYAVLCSMRDIALAANLDSAPEPQKVLSIVFFLSHIILYGVGVAIAPHCYGHLAAGAVATSIAAVAAYLPGWLLIRVERRGLLV